MKFLSSLLIFLTTVSISFSQDHTNKTALVIGNMDYSVGKLKNPVNDARDLSNTLKEMGFSVTTKYNVNRTQLREAIREFGWSIENKKGIALFYFSGHGIQSLGRNYLIPVDADIQENYEIEDQCISADQVLRMLDQYQNPLNIIILDACRNNPYASNYRSQEQGLAQPENAPTGSMIAFATSPGKLASDGVGANGLYTQELIKAINTPGLKIEEVFKETRINVDKLSKGEQVPWENTSLLGDFYFLEEKDQAQVFQEIRFMVDEPLYMNCANKLEVVMADSDLPFTPTFVAEGATIIEDDGNGKMTIVPFEQCVTITIKDKGEIIGTKRFSVKRIPPPIISFWAEGEQISRHFGFPSPGPDSIDLVITPDKTFATQFPKEARYTVEEWDIFLRRVNDAVVMRTIYDHNASLSAFQDKAEAGDYLVIKINKMRRRNYKYEWEIVNLMELRDYIFTIPLN